MLTDIHRGDSCIISKQFFVQALPLDVEIVAFNQGFNMLKFDSEVGARLKKAAAGGVALRACGVTMGKMKVAEKDLYPDAAIKIVPAGVVKIMQKHQAGWFHIRP